MSFSNQCVSFPVSQTFSLFSRVRTFFDTAPIGQFSTVVMLSVTFPSLFLTTQMGLKAASRLFIGQNVLIYPFKADLDTLAFFKPSRYLFWTPIFSQPFLDYSPGCCQDPWLCFRSAIDRFFVCLLRTIATLTCIPIQFAINGGSMNSNRLCDFASTMSRCLQFINLVSLFLGKLSVRSHKCSFDLAVLEPMLPQLTSPSTAFVALLS